MRCSAFTLVTALSLVACGSGTPASPGPAAPGTPARGAGASSQGSAEVELRLDETVEAQGLTLRWLELEDSRCAIGVVCIWQGEAAVTLEVADGGDEPIRVRLVHQAGQEAEPVRAFDRELRLLGVDPYPQEGVTPEREEHVARIEIVQP